MNLVSNLTQRKKDINTYSACLRFINLFTNQSWINKLRNYGADTTFVLKKITLAQSLVVNRVFTQAEW